MLADSQHSHPNHVEKRNKHPKKNCAPSWLYLQDGNGKCSAKCWTRPDRFIFWNVTLIWLHHCFNTCLIWEHLCLTPPTARHCNRSQFYTLFTEFFGERVCLFVFWRNSPHWAKASSFTRFLDHTQRRTTVGRTPLDEWSAHHRDLGDRVIIIIVLWLPYSPVLDQCDVCFWGMLRAKVYSVNPLTLKENIQNILF